jgi:hypothetical protein
MGFSAGSAQVWRTRRFGELIAGRSGCDRPAVYVPKVMLARLAWRTPPVFDATAHLHFPLAVLRGTSQLQRM